MAMQGVKSEVREYLTYYIVGIYLPPGKHETTGTKLEWWIEFQGWEWSIMETIRVPEKHFHTLERWIEREQGRQEHPVDA